jgi:copper resistance protein D
MTGLMIAARLAQFAAVMVLFGASLLRWYSDRWLQAPPRELFDAWLRKVLLVAALLALLSAIAWFDGVAMSMGDGWPSAVDMATLQAVLWDTSFGSIWIWRLSIAGVLIAVLILLPLSPRGFVQRAVVPILSGALAASLALVGHTALGTDGTRLLHIASQAAHLLAGSIWLGGLVPLAYLLARARSDRRWLPLLDQIVPRFSRWGYCAVALLLVSGCFNSWIVVGRWEALISTGHGRVLSVKVLLFLLMVSLAIANRGWLAPQALAAEARAPAPPRALLGFQRSVTGELALGFLVLLAASLLGMLNPST